MTFQSSTIEPLKSHNILIDFLYLHKWTLTMWGGVFLSIPTLKHEPTIIGIVGIFITIIGGIAQIVKIINENHEERRKEEIHKAKMLLFAEHLKAGRLDEAGEVLS